MKRVLRTVGSSFAALVLSSGAIALVLIGLVVVNGGYTWRTDCVTERGTVKREWTYKPGFDSKVQKPVAWH